MSRDKHSFLPLGPLDWTLYCQKYCFSFDFVDPGEVINEFSLSLESVWKKHEREMNRYDILLRNLISYCHIDINI